MTGSLRRGQIHLHLQQVASHQDDPGLERHRKQPFKSHQKSQATCTNPGMICQHKCTVKVKVGRGDLMPLVLLVTDAHGQILGCDAHEN